MTECYVVLDSDGKFMDLIDADGQPVSFVLRAHGDVEGIGNEDVEDFLGCEHCGQTSGPLQDCTGCDAVKYCSGKCQQTDWTVSHRQECKNLKIGLYGSGRGSFYRTPHYRGRRYPGRGYGGRGGYWRWRSLYGNYGWYNPYYYNYWRGWYPRRYRYTVAAEQTAAIPALPTFNPKLVPPPDVDKTLQQLRQKHDEILKRTGFVIVPDYEAGQFRWAVAEAQ